jgi:hypothetical protein
VAGAGAIFADGGAGPASRPGSSYERFSQRGSGVGKRSASEILMEKKLLKLEEELALLREEVSRKKDKKK